MIGNTYNYNGLGAVNIRGIAPDDTSGFYETRNETVKQRIADNTYLNESEERYWLKKSLSSHILQLLPYQALSGLSQFKQYFSWSFGNIVLNLFTMTVLVYLTISALALFLAALSFKKHQIQ